MKTTRIAKKQTNIHYDQNVFMKLFVHALFEIIKCYITFQSEIYTKINQKDSIVLHIIHTTIISMIDFINHFFAKHKVLINDIG